VSLSPDRKGYGGSRRVSFIRVEKMKRAEVPNLFTEVPEDMFCERCAGVARVASLSRWGKSLPLEGGGG